ncbi:MAG: hypothetical protein ACLRQF_13855 [Thomasclavelia ramosa]
MEYQDRLFNQKNRASMDKIINNLPGGIIVLKCRKIRLKHYFQMTRTYQLFGYSKETFKTVFHSEYFLKLFINLMHLYKKNFMKLRMKNHLSMAAVVFVMMGH